MLFGNEAAEKDDLLYDCAINCYNEYKTIIIGKWGTGKTAKLLLLAREVEEFLESINKKYSRCWYIDENSLSIDSIKRKKTQIEDIRFDEYLKSIWKAEIIRRAVLQLGYAADRYHELLGNRSINQRAWDFVKKFTKNNDIKHTLWRQIDGIIDFLHDHFKININVKEDIKMLFEEITFDHVQSCLRDLEAIDEKYRPLIAIEPIETPASPLENENGLADSIIRALLNIYQSDLQFEKKRQLLRVFIAIPWHRDTLAFNFPQKIEQYKEYLRWDCDQLGDFINLRIKKEFENHGRSGAGNANFWNQLFNHEVVYHYKDQPSVLENSFAYVLRHTHHRPREIQRVTRTIVETAASWKKCSPNAVLKEKEIIGMACVTEGVTQFINRAAKEMEEEVRRRYKMINHILDCMFGMHIPFTLDDLAKKLASIKDKIGFNSCIDILWRSGILGIEQSCSSHYFSNNRHIFSKENIKSDKNIINHQSQRAYFFEYNYDGNPLDLLKISTDISSIKSQLIIHPKFSIRLACQVDSAWPVGK